VGGEGDGGRRGGGSAMRGGAVVGGDGGRRGRGRAMGGGAVVGGDGGAGAAQWSATQRCADQIIAGTFI
jgi:hypothetical protein